MEEDMQASSSSSSSKEVPLPKDKFCYECGKTILQKHSRFCHNCGKKINQATTKDDQDKIREALGNIKAKRLVTKKESEKKGKKRKMKKTAPKNNVAVKARIEKEKKKKKLVHLGWKHYDPIKGKYVQVRGDRGGGTIKVRLDWETDYHQLLQRMLDTFFPEGRSPLGVLEDINYSLGIYNSDEDLTFIRTSAGVLPFTLRDHFNLKKGDYHIRFYLYTTFKRAQAVSQSEPQISAISPISPLHDDSSVSSVDPLDDLFVPSSEEEAFKQRIGAIVNASQQFPQPYETSDAHTSEGNNANTEEFEMVEPPVSFRDGPSTSFMEVVVTAGPSSNSTSNGNMSGREERLQQSVDSDGEPRKVMLHRINIFNELIDVFSDPNILNESLYFVLIETNGREEKGQDTGGVYRDVLTAFWQTFCNSCCTGEAERVPALRHDFQEAKWQCCARVLLKGFMDMRYWPLQLCHAFLCHSLFGMQGVTDEMLCNSFQSFVDVADAKVITSIMEDKSSDLDETLIEEFQDMLSRYNGRKVATKENVKSLVVELAHKELIQSPKYISAAWAPELLPLTANHEEFFSPISFLHFMASLRPDGKGVAAMLNANPQNENERVCFGFLKRFVRGLNEVHLHSFLKFVTGADMLCYDVISVTFKAVEGLARRPIATTCSCLLELPSTYESFPDLRNEFFNILKNDDWPIDFA